MDLLTILTFIALVLIILKIYNKLTVGWDRSYTCLIGKTAVVTGANTGIGFYTALDFAKRGARVILACRNKEKAENARKIIIKITGNPNVVVKNYDAASFASVRAFAKDFNETEGRLDILVNNAGIGADRMRKKSEDGYNFVMQVNYYSSFLLTHLLIDKLKASAPSRVVNVSSVMHRIADLDPDNLDRYPKERSFPTYINYANSKLGNIVFTIELARRLDGTGVTTNALHPGAILTDIFNGMRGWQAILFKFFATLYFKTPLEGAQTSIYLAVSPEVQNISGQYFSDCAERSLSREITQHNFVKKIWEKTEEIVHLTPQEKLN
ncbi:retinol dehydrogenase 11-like [Agrilus planipennis]|uniref:Retinol dehydrogenase 11-like n=1 Tax=Agrilus planipennis TaxID=224129 RepID=A0A1W4WGA8_AGRPL|nr:retinol dehydrogenase 11-like [Agrilus planipennis]